MKGLTRRGFGFTLLGVAGLGALGAGGSVAFCSGGGARQAALVRPLFVALEDMVAPARIGQGWRSVMSRMPEHDILSRADLTGAALIADVDLRRGHLRTIVRDDFARGDVVLADGFLVSRAEALIAAAWVG